MVKNVYLEQLCSNGIIGSKKSSECENAKIGDENNADGISFML
jgi:hypothetical protein